MGVFEGARLLEVVIQRHFLAVCAAAAGGFSGIALWLAGVDTETVMHFVERLL